MYGVYFIVIQCVANIQKDGFLRQIALLYMTRQTPLQTIVAQLVTKKAYLCPKDSVSLPQRWSI